MAEVFISYARPDEPVARRLAKALKANGFEVWSDADLPAHRAYSDVIEKHLRDAVAVVVLWSKSAAQSQWVRAEADFARAEGKLVQAQLDGSLPPMPFNQIQCANLKGWRGSMNHAGWTKLKDSISALISGEDTAPASHDEQPKWWTGRGLQLAAAVGVLLLAGALWMMPRWLGSDEGKRPIVAVLPFESLDKRDESLVAGIWEDTRQAIGRNPQLLVLGPNTAQQLAAKGGEAASKAADYLVQATVRSTGDRIRVNTNLVRTKDGAQLWSENFDRRLDDVFVLQSDIAHAIEGRIRGRLARGGGVQPENIATSGEVYALYSDARAKIRKRQMARYEEAYQQLRRVVGMDPNFAPGWATLAVIKHFGVARESDPTAEADARRAIALAPNLAAGHAALGFVINQGPVAQASLRRAMELDPNDFEAIHWLANSLDDTRVQEKLNLYSKVVELEPLWWPAILNKLNLLFELGDSGAIDREFKRLERIGDTNLSTLIRIEQAQRAGDLSTAVNLALGKYRSVSGAEKELFSMRLVQPLYQLGYLEVGDRLSPPPNDFIPYLRRNDMHALDMIEASLPPRAFWTYGYLAEVGGRVCLRNGKGPRLAKLYRAVASNPEEFEAVVGKERLANIAPLAALALQSVGDKDQARKLLALAETRIEISSGSPVDRRISRARILAAQGRSAEAISELSAAVRGGWLPPYLPILPDLEHDPALAQLKKYPRFQQLRQQVLRHLSKERAELGSVSL